MLSLRSDSICATPVVNRPEQRGKALSVDTRHRQTHTVTRTTMETSFLVDGLGLDPSLFDPPIHLLPPELLSYIFAFNDDPATDTFPTVAHVCGYWRQVAFNTPKLWSKIVLDISSSLNRRLNSQLQLLDTCLALSKSIPLDFVVALRSRRDSTTDAVLSRLCLHTHRWRRAVFFASTDVLAPWAHLIQGKTPILESIGLGSLDGNIGSVDLQHIFASPSISTLALTFCQNETLNVMNVPWHQITSLTLVRCSFHTLPAIFDRFPNLEQLEIKGEFSYCNNETYPIQPVELPKLLTLGVTGALHRMPDLLSTFSTPALIDLSITVFKGTYVSDNCAAVGVRAIQDFLSQAEKVKCPVVEFVDWDVEDTIWDHAIQYIQ